MRPRFLFTASLLVIVVVLGGPAAQAQGPNSARYTITDLGTLGGSYSYAYGINNTGVVAGGAATPDQSDGISQTGFLWSRGQRISVGTLGGSACPNCNSEAGGPNAFGEAVIVSETATTDPNGEDFCGFGTHRQCLGAVWKNGSLTALSTLQPGLNDQAYWVNNRGEVIGFSESGAYDLTCSDAMPFQVFRYQAVKWSPTGVPQPLSPLPGDTVSFGFGINENGQAVGVSGLCSNTTLPPNYQPGGPHAVLWDSDGSPTDLGSLPGGIGNNVATSINNRGEVVGTAALSDGTIHAFLWSRAAGMRDIGTLPGAFVTVAPCCNSINNRGDIAGFSIDASGPRAFVWKDNVLMDLNTVLPADSPWYLLVALSINDSGQIVGFGVNTETFEVHAFLATPISSGAPAARGATKALPLPQSVTAFVQRHFR